MKWIKALLPTRTRTAVAPLDVAASERQRAIDLVAAVDRGGLPLNPARVNATARSLGLEVSLDAPMDHTIVRIREALARTAGSVDPAGSA